MEAEDSHARFEVPVERYTALGPSSPVEETRRQRFSAVVDGICIGVGMVFIVLGVLMSIAGAGMLVQGLVSIIGGIVVLAVGIIVEVYNWARLR